MAEFKAKIDEIYRSTESLSQYNSLRLVCKNDLIRADEERMRSKDVLEDHQTYNRSFSCPEVFQHDKYPGEVHEYAARIAPNILDKDELTSAQAKGKALEIEWPLWLEALRKELTSLIIDNEVFDPIKY